MKKILVKAVALLTAVTIVSFFSVSCASKSEAPAVTEEPLNVSTDTNKKNTDIAAEAPVIEPDTSSELIDDTYADTGLEKINEPGMVVMEERTDLSDSMTTPTQTKPNFTNSDGSDSSDSSNKNDSNSSNNTNKNGSDSSNSSNSNKNNSASSSSSSNANKNANSSNSSNANKNNSASSSSSNNANKNANKNNSASSSSSSNANKNANSSNSSNANKNDSASSSSSNNANKNADSSNSSNANKNNSASSSSSNNANKNANSSNSSNANKNNSASSNSSNNANKNANSSNSTNDNANANNGANKGGVNVSSNEGSSKEAKNTLVRGHLIVLDGAEFYIVKKGDMLIKIAEAYYGADKGNYFPVIIAGTEEEIIDADVIEVGQRLTIPDLKAVFSTEESRKYIKDTFYDVADKYEQKGKPGMASQLREIAASL